MAKISIIIPVYNCELYLDECIKSILSQSYSDYKLILVNDGSQDSSLSICNKYQRMNNKVFVIDQKNQGVSIARNNGLRICDTPYVMFVDSDDFLETNALSKMMSIYSNDNPDLVVCGLKCFSKNNQEICAWRYKGGKYSILEYIDVLLYFRTIPFVGGPVAKIYSKQIIDKVKLNFEENQSFAEDFVFNMKYLQNVKRIQVIDDCFYHRREDNLSSLSKSTRLQIPLWERKKNVNFIWNETLSKISKNAITDNVLIQKFAVKSIIDLFQSKTEKKQRKNFIRRIFSDTEEIISSSKKIKSYLIIKRLYNFNKNICFAFIKLMGNSTFTKLSIFKRLNR